LCSKKHNIEQIKIKFFSSNIYIFVYRRTRGTGTPTMPTQLCSAVRQVFTRSRRRRSGSSRFVLSYETSLMQRVVFKRTIFHALLKSTDSECGLCYTKYNAMLRSTDSECGLCYTKYQALLRSTDSECGLCYTKYHALLRSTGSECGLCYTKYHALLRSTDSEYGLSYTKYHTLLKSLPGNIVSSVSDAKIWHLIAFPLYDTEIPHT